MLAGGNELGPTRDATTVRVRADETLVTDGPYAEVKEALGGFYPPRVRRRWTTRSTGPRGSPAREHGAVEVRPVHVDPEEVQL